MTAPASRSVRSATFLPAPATWAVIASRSLPDRPFRLARLVGYCCCFGVAVSADAPRFLGPGPDR